MCDRPDTHLHHYPQSRPIMFAGYTIVVGGRAVALTADHLVAERLMQLIDEHGLLGVPDTLEGAT